MRAFIALRDGCFQFLLPGHPPASVDRTLNCELNKPFIRQVDFVKSIFLNHSNKIGN